MFDPCPEYQRQEDCQYLHLEPCCVNCLHLDDEYPCPELSDRFKEGLGWTPPQP